MKNALVLVDIQNDFCPGGALAVPHGHDVVPVANRLIDHFRATGGLVVATQDWHPPNHVSFVSQNPGLKFGDMILDVDGLPQEIWPDHCVQNTPGADFVSGLNVEGIQAVVQKGTDPQIDSYSGFFDNNHKKATELASVLRRHGVDSVYVLGLATDYCVKFTALDARSLGFQTYFVRDASRAIGDEDSAVAAMVDAGVRVLTSAQLL